MAEVHHPKSAAKGTEGASTRYKDVGQLVELMLKLGKAVLASGEAVTQHELLMRRMATAYGDPKLVSYMVPDRPSCSG